MGDFTDQYDNVIQIGTGFEIQVVDGYGGGISAAMSSGGGTGYSKSLPPNSRPNPLISGWMTTCN